MAILLFLNLIFSNFQQEKLQKTELTDNITMLIPETFRPMTDDEIANKYFTTRKPMVMFTNQDLTIDFGVNKSATKWGDDDFEIMMSFQKANIFSLYDEVDVISEGTNEVKGKKYAYYEFVSTVLGDEEAFIKQGSIKKYTYIQYIIVDKVTLVFNFTCDSRVKDRWAPVAKQMMESIDIKGKLK